ncbi:LuxR family transcriptional regulator [Mycolicibacter heraklionensis]|nr:LuxR family transcriptional regulator [Mycolicibacter heraklionensis]
MSETSWNGTDMSDIGELPTGTVTLLLADVEGSTRLWETQPEAMRAAVARLDQVLAHVVSQHHGVRPVEQGEGDSCVVAFARAADALACALDLQRSALAPIKLRIGLHTGDVQLRDEGNYIGPTINRTARLRDLAHGGQTVLSGTTELLVVDQLPTGVVLTDLGTHPLRDLPRPERVVQLCHPDLCNDFPPLRVASPVDLNHLPVHLTSFIGRRQEIVDVGKALSENRLVTLTGAGGAGKTRLAVQVAGIVAANFAGGVCYVDLAPIIDPKMVAVTTARALGLPDQPGQPLSDMLRRFLRDREVLIVLDNCEHLLDACAELITGLLAACPAVTWLTTSREPIGVTGEVSWRVPSLGLADEAIELFGDRARRTKPGFSVTSENLDTVTEICRRLDGLPLAIELAAARVRALSPNEIRDSLHDTFRLLTGGARTAVRRQQTLRASVDWSHALLSEPEQVLFRRLAVFLGGGDLDAAQAIMGGEIERYQVLDQLVLLVDKSLVVADDSSHGTRYRLLETVRQYAMEKLSESREAGEIRNRHRDHYAAMATALGAPGEVGQERIIDRLDAEIDNLRAAFAWSKECSDTDRALILAAALQPLWLTRGRIQEGLSWLTASPDPDPAGSEMSEARVWASVCRAQLLSFLGRTDVLDDAEQCLAVVRECGDTAMLARTLAACGMICAPGNPELARGYFTEAADFARAVNDLGTLGQVLASNAIAGLMLDQPLAEIQTAAEEGLRIAEGIGAAFIARQCRFALGWAQMYGGDLSGAVTRLGEVIEDAARANDAMYSIYGHTMRTFVLAYAGDAAGSRAEAAAASGSVSLFEYYNGPVHCAQGMAHLASGDASAARQAFETARECSGLDPQTASSFVWAALAPLACGDIADAGRWADDIAASTRGYGRALTLVARARVGIARCDVAAAERDAYEALAIAVELGAPFVVPFALACLGHTMSATENNVVAARLFGAAEAARQLIGLEPLAVLAEQDQSALSGLRATLGEKDFGAAWAEGAALSIDEAIGYAQRGKGERRRAESGWSSLTRAEREVVRLVSEGLGNKEVAARLFVSPRTVQAHLTHVYTKLGLTSRVQLAQEAARH